MLTTTDNQGIWVGQQWAPNIICQFRDNHTCRSRKWC